MWRKPFRHYFYNNLNEIIGIKVILWKTKHVFGLVVF